MFKYSTYEVVEQERTWTTTLLRADLSKILPRHPISWEGDQLQAFLPFEIFMRDRPGWGLTDVKPIPAATGVDKVVAVFQHYRSVSFFLFF